MATHMTYPGPETYPQHQTQQEFYPPYSGFQSFQEGDYHHPNGYHGYYPNYGRVWHANPDLQYYPYYDQPGPSVSEHMIPNLCPCQPMPPPTNQAQTITSSESHNSDLNLTGARLATQQASGN